MLYVRSRQGPRGPFLEIFLVLTRDKTLGLPEVAIAKFEARILGRYVWQGPRGPLTIAIVNSSPFSEPMMRTHTSLLADGIWATFSDTKPKGFVPATPTTAAVSARAVVFGVPVSTIVSEAFMPLAATQQIYALVSAKVPDLNHSNDPIVVYHGTAKESAPGIFKLGLRPTFGMLGTAVYFGSFWKAFRFATRTQGYELREGAILRCLAFWRAVHVKTGLDKPCACEKCCLKAPNCIVDHLGSWALKYEAVVVLPQSTIVKNEEYASPDASLVVVDSYGYAASTSKHHEPCNRDVHIA